MAVRPLFDRKTPAFCAPAQTCGEGRHDSKLAAHKPSRRFKPDIRRLSYNCLRAVLIQGRRLRS